MKLTCAEYNGYVHSSQLDQLQLALPSRDYYTKSPTETELRAYHKYMTEVAILMGADNTTAAAEMTDVINFEKRLAEVSVPALPCSTGGDGGGRLNPASRHPLQASLPEADRHDTSLIYQQLPLWRLQQDVPELDWHLFLTTVLMTNISMDEPVVCYGLPYFRAMGKVLVETDRRYVTSRSLAGHRHQPLAPSPLRFHRALRGLVVVAGWSTTTCSGGCSCP